jgi:ribosomal protein S18 acetylase RimI-like enzyme
MIEIRPIADDDFEAVAVVHIRTWQAAYAGIVPADFLAAMDVAANVERRRNRTVPPGARTLVATDDGQVVGFVAFGPYLEDDGVRLDRGQLYAIYVSPDHWGRGTGRLLFDAAKAGLATAGFPDMRLWVLDENHPARRFYERMGMAPDGARAYYTPDGTRVELPELRYAMAL